MREANQENKKETHSNGIVDDEANEQQSSCLASINRTLLTSKVFYFFYFSACGSLIPYLALYFKEMKLSPSQVGILMGLRPFVNFVCIPIWGLFVDRFKKGQYVLVVSLVVSILTSFSLSLIAPAENICTESVRNQTVSKRTTHNRSVIFVPLIGTFNSTLNAYNIYPSTTTAEPWPLVFLSIEETKKSKSTNQLFLHLFLLLFLGNIIASPSLALVDTITMRNLGSEKHKYGVQRLWGSLGFGLAAFIVGAIVSVNHFCPTPFIKSSDVNYSACFYSFVILMSLALLSSFDFRFPTSDSLQTEVNTVAIGPEEKMPSVRRTISGTFIMFLLTAFFFGFMVAFIKTFLFWHLKDIGGTQLLFCIVAAFNCIAEVTMYFLSANLITKIGHTRVLYLGAICYAIRCFVYSLVPNPWFVLPLEVLSGITSAASWAAMLSYVSEQSFDRYATTFQGVLHSVHWGLGHGAGEMIGGLLVNTIGTAKTFFILGLASLVIMTLYVITNNIDIFIRKIKTKLLKYVE